MDEKEVLDVLELYRHDLLNELQIIQGYLSMEMTEKAKAKMKVYTDTLHEERKLMGLNVPSFALWLIRFNAVHRPIRLTYSIHMENVDLGPWDKKLVRFLNHILESLEKRLDRETMFEGWLEVKRSSAGNAAEIELFMDIPDIVHMDIPSEIADESGSLSMQTKQKVQGVSFTVTIPLDETG